MATASQPTVTVRVEHIMGMPIVADVRDAEDPEALEPLFDWFRFVDATFSTYIADSEISRLNRGEIAPSETHHEVRAVLTRCEELRIKTDGYFDVRAQRDDYVDPSGLVKGWAVDRAAAIAGQLGWRNYAINAGGDIRLRGGASPAPRWQVGIQHPHDRQKIAAVVVGDDLAIATSGTYARGAHIFNPHTHNPPEGILSVTMTGPELATADAFATAAFAMGLGGPAWTARLNGGYEAMTVMADGRSLRTPGFPSLATEPAPGSRRGRAKSCA